MLPLSSRSLEAIRAQMAAVPSSDLAGNEVEIGAREDTIIVIHDGPLGALNSFLANPFGDTGIFIRVYQLIFWIADGFYSDENGSR